MFSQSSFVVALPPLNGKISIRTAVQSELHAMSLGDMSRQTSHAQSRQYNGLLFPGKEDHRGDTMDTVVCGNWFPWKESVDNRGSQGLKGNSLVSASCRRFPMDSEA
jgi:hypothetical protein